jgi:hypothetical protein
MHAGMADEQAITRGVAAELCTQLLFGSHGNLHMSHLCQLFHNLFQLIKELHEHTTKLL